MAETQQNQTVQRERRQISVKQTTQILQKNRIWQANGQGSTQL